MARKIHKVQKEANLELDKMEEASSRAFGKKSKGATQAARSKAEIDRLRSHEKLNKNFKKQETLLKFGDIKFRNER